MAVRSANGQSGFQFFIAPRPPAPDIYYESTAAPCRSSQRRSETASMTKRRTCDDAHAPTEKAIG